MASLSDGLGGCECAVFASCASVKGDVWGFCRALPSLTRTCASLVFLHSEAKRASAAARAPSRSSLRAEEKLYVDQCRQSASDPVSHLLSASTGLSGKDIRRIADIEQLHRLTQEDMASLNAKRAEMSPAEFSAACERGKLSLLTRRHTAVQDKITKLSADYRVRSTAVHRLAG